MSDDDNLVINAAGLAGVVAVFCLYLGLTPVQADEVWDSLGSKQIKPANRPSVLYRQVYEEAKKLGLTDR